MDFTHKETHIRKHAHKTLQICYGGKVPLDKLHVLPVELRPRILAMFWNSNVVLAGVAGVRMELEANRK